MTHIEQGSIHTCQWIFLPSLADKRQRVCGDSVEGDSRYCPTHNQEMAAFMASNVESHNPAVGRLSKLRAAAVIPITALQKRDLSGAQFEANVALDYIYIAVQQIRELVNRAERCRKTDWDSCLWSLENDMRRATSRLRDATKIIRRVLFR